MIKLSVTEKLGCYSWSLNAVETCPGARARGELVEACRGCYARGGNYRFTPVRAVRDHNRVDWKRPDWVCDMVNALRGQSRFRWFDSGDVYCEALAVKIHDVVKLTPKTRHWLPTRSYKFEKIRRVLERINALPNACVRYSSDSARGDYEAGVHGSTIHAHGQRVAGAKHCFAWKREGRCGGCVACWDKSVAVVAYKQHGRGMLALNKRLEGLT